MNQNMNQSGIAPPQLPKWQTTALSTIISASVGITALTSSSLPLNAVQQFALSSLSAAKISQEAYDKIFGDMDKAYVNEIEKFVYMVKDKFLTKINGGANNAGKYSIFQGAFRTIYRGQLDADTAVYYAWKLFKLLL